MKKTASTRRTTALRMDTVARVNQAGQLLVRAAAVLDQVPKDEVKLLEEIAGGSLPAGIRTLLNAAMKVDKSLAGAVATVSAHGSGHEP